MRLAFVHNRYIGYRIPLFKLISRAFDTTFFFDSERPKPKTQIHSSFSLTFHLPRRPRYRLSPTLPIKLLRGNFDVFIAGDTGLANTYLTCCIAKLENKPFIVWSEEWHPDWYLTKKQFHWKRKLVSVADACVASGIKSKEFFQFLGVPDKKIFIAPDVSIPKEPVNLKYCLSDIGINIAEDSMVILYLGRLVRGKGTSFLMEAFIKINQEFGNVALIIAGTGPLLRHIKEEISRSKLKNVIMTGKAANELEKNILYSSCDIFVIPSVYHRNVEPWGLVLNEAMYFSKPVIATNMVGSSYDLVRDGINGYVIPERNVYALYQALRKIIANKYLRKKMGIESKKIVAGKFDWDHMVQGFKDAIIFAHKNRQLGYW